VDRVGHRRAGSFRRGPFAARLAVFATPARHPESRGRIGRVARAITSGRRAERFLGVLHFHDRGFRAPAELWCVCDDLLQGKRCGIGRRTRSSLSVR